MHKGKLGTSAFYRDLVVDDLEKQFVLKLVRDLSAEQIQGTFRSHLVANRLVLRGSGRLRIRQRTVGSIGYLVAGPAGAVVAALATFLPCYVFTVVPAPHFSR